MSRALNTPIYSFSGPGMPSNTNHSLSVPWALISLPPSYSGVLNHGLGTNDIECHMDELDKMESNL